MIPKPTIGSLFRARRDVAWLHKISIPTVANKSIELLEVSPEEIKAGEFVQLIGVSSMGQEVPALVNTHGVLYKILILSQGRIGFFRVQEGSQWNTHQQSARAFLEFTHFFELIQ